MDADQLREGTDGEEGSATAIVATPVSAGASGEGLPYAPEDWPSPGDKWRWRVGMRATPTGYFQDRYTCPPARFNHKNGHKGWICGRLSLEKFVCEHIPNADVGEFFASFIWKIPFDPIKLHKDSNPKGLSCSQCRFASSNGHMETRVMPKDGECKAGNKMCYAWVQTRKGSSPIIDCDLCCSEVGFCRDCCCILCCKTVDLACYGYNYIRCQGIIDADFICGHVAHMKCALRAYLAGRVRGSINLDAEYYCRRCDNKTDLVAHLSRLLTGSKTVHSRADTKKILNMGLCVLRGSGRCEARKLHSLVVSMLKKFKDGVNLAEIWALEDSLHTVTTVKVGSRPVKETPVFPQQQLEMGETANLNLPAPLLISSNGKEPTRLKLHEVPISLQIQDPSAEPPQEILSHKRRSHKVLWPEPGSHKKVRQQVSLPGVQEHPKQCVATKEPREVWEEDSDLREGAEPPPGTKLRINHLDTELNQMKAKIVSQLKISRKEVLGHVEAKLKEVREGVAKLNNESKWSPQRISKECKRSKGLEKLDCRLNRALGYCQALMHFHRKYPVIDISEFYESLRRMIDMDSVESIQL